MNLKGNGFILREWIDTDAEKLVSIANEEDIYNNLRDSFPHPYRLSDAKNWINMTKFKKDSNLYFAIEVNGNLAGSIGVAFKEDVYRKNAEIGYYLSKAYRGKGIMTNSIKVIVDFIFNNFDIIRIFAEPFANNIASRKVLENSGFCCEALLKSYIVKQNLILDGCIYSLLKENWNKTEIKK